MSNVIPLPDRNSLVAAVAENVRVECARRNWNQSDVARLLGVASATVNKRWMGARQWQLEDLDVIATAMGIPASRFLARSEGFEPPTFWLVVTEGPDLTGADAEHSAEVFDFATGKRVA